MLMAAAKLLAAIDAPVADPKASADGKPVFYDVDAIVAEADGLPPTAVPSRPHGITPASATTNISATA